VNLMRFENLGAGAKGVRQQPAAAVAGIPSPVRNAGPARQQSGVETVREKDREVEMLLTKLRGQRTAVTMPERPEFYAKVQ